MLVEENEVAQQGHVGWEDLTPPSSPAPVTDADAEQWRDLFIPGMGTGEIVHRLLADRARVQEAMRQELKMWGEFRRALRTALWPFWPSNPMVGNEEIVDATHRVLADRAQREERIRELEAGLKDLSHTGDQYTLNKIRALLGEMPDGPA